MSTTMLRRLRSLYSGIRQRQAHDEAHLTYFGTLAPREVRMEQARQEVITVLSRMPLH